jgi:hypothetical protein
MRRRKSKHQDMPGTRQRVYRQNNPEKVTAYERKRSVLRSYGITREHYEAIMDAAVECPICRINFEFAKKTYDHSHESGTHRGVLCARCNAALGAFGDHIPGLIKAIEYLLEADINDAIDFKDATLRLCSILNRMCGLPAGHERDTVPLHESADIAGHGDGDLLPEPVRPYDPWRD